MSWAKGEIAEDFVAGRLESHGWILCARNYRRKGLELDIVAAKGDRLICVEVKARSTIAFLHPSSILGSQKLRKLSEGMSKWLQLEAPNETRNAEFWLCSVLLPIDRNSVEWIRIDI